MNTSTVISVVIIVGFIIVSVLYCLVRFADRKNKRLLIGKIPPLYKYTRKDHIMTAPEDIFFKMLQETAGDRYFVFPQVHLSAILDYKVPGQNWKPAFRHINGKSVDFVLCDKTSLKPMYAVELDDSSHNQESRKERDVEVERIFEAASLPLVRFVNYRSVTLDDIAKKFYEAKLEV